MSFATTRACVRVCRRPMHVVIAMLAAAGAVASGAIDAREISGTLSARPMTSASALVTAGRHRVRAGASATLYVPASIPTGTSAPFLLLLHGAGGKGDDMIRRFKTQADTRGIVLLAPDSAERTWDVALSMGQRGSPPGFGRDIRRIDALLQDVFARVKVDPQHVAVAGFSDGASTALSIGSRNTAVFPATLAFSAGGMVPDWSGPPGRMFISHGEKDPILPIGIARNSLVPSLRATGFSVKFVAFDGGHEVPDTVLEQAMVWWLGER